MRNPKGVRHHKCSPTDWRTVPMLSGDYDFDASIVHSRNKAVPARLALYLTDQRGGYRPISGYDGYAAYTGDD